MKKAFLLIVLPFRKLQNRVFLYCLLTVLIFSCKKPAADGGKSAGSAYQSPPQHITITGGSIPEASGIADSKANPGYLWVEEDSGNPSQLWLLSHTGKIAGKVAVKGAANRDWEDIVLGPGPVDGTNYLYIGDIGDNYSTYTKYSFYRFAEPAIDTTAPGKTPVTGYQKISFVYPDGSHDAEAFLVDANTKDIYIITKRDDSSRIYKLPYPQSTQNSSNAVYVSSLAFNDVTSAALSPDNRQLIVKTYSALYLYERNPSEPISVTLAGTPSMIPYDPEVQGEAVCFSLDNTGFFTLSEMRDGIPVTLDFYRHN